MDSGEDCREATRTRWRSSIRPVAPRRLSLVDITMPQRTSAEQPPRHMPPARRSTTRLAALNRPQLAVLAVAVPRALGGPGAGGNVSPWLASQCRASSSYSGMGEVVIDRRTGIVGTVRRPHGACCTACRAESDDAAARPRCLARARAGCRRRRAVEGCPSRQDSFSFVRGAARPRKKTKNLRTWLFRFHRPLVSSQMLSRRRRQGVIARTTVPCAVTRAGVALRGLRRARGPDGAWLVGPRPTESHPRRLDAVR